MVGSTDIVIVSLIAIASVVLVGVLGHFLDKNADPTEDKVNK